MTNTIEPSSPQKMDDELKMGKFLFEEAEKRGFKKGVVAIHLTDNLKKTITSSDYQYYPNNDSLYVGLAGETIRIYHNGKWSKVVDKWWMAVEVGDYLECEDGLVKNEKINGHGYESGLKFKVTSIALQNGRHCFFGGKEDNGVYYSAIKNPYLKENEKIDILPESWHIETKNDFEFNSVLNWLISEGFISEIHATKKRLPYGSYIGIKNRELIIGNCASGIKHGKEISFDYFEKNVLINNIYKQLKTKKDGKRTKSFKVQRESHEVSRGQRKTGNFLAIGRPARTVKGRYKGNVPKM